MTRSINRDNVRQRELDGFRFNVIDYGAVGDGVTDDTAAFKGVRDAWKATVAVDLSVDVDVNEVSAAAIVIPSGNYLITEAEAFLDSDYTERAMSMEWVGDGWQGAVTILYRPTTAGALIYNNNSVLGMRFKNIRFDADGATHDFMFSTANGGSQRHMFDHCSWGGNWRYGVHLQGSDNNSEYTWNDCWIVGDWTAFLFAETSDQFLNYWFNRGGVWTFTGNFIKMTKGGHIKITGMDFSGYEPTSDNYLFRLEGFSHSQGICAFTCKDARFELKSAEALVMYCEWPQGMVSFEDVDFSSQVTQAWATTHKPFHFDLENVAGPAIRFTSCNLMGIHSYRSSNSGSDMKKSVVYENCATFAFRDFYDMFDVAMTSGSNVGALPCIKTTKCRGKQEIFSSTYTVWAASTAYIIGDQRYAGIWLYECTVGGTSHASNQPSGAGSAIADGTVTWKHLEIYPTNDYITEGGFGWDQARNSAGGKKVAVIRGSDGKWPARVSASVPGAVRTVLPPNSIVTAVYLDLPAGVLSEASDGTFHVKTDEEVPTTFINVTSAGNLSAGLTDSWTGFFDTTTTLSTRAIILEAQTDVEQFAPHPAICLIEYISGD